MRDGLAAGKPGMRLDRFDRRLDDDAVNRTRQRSTRSLPEQRVILRIGEHGIDAEAEHRERGVAGMGCSPFSFAHRP